MSTLHVRRSLKEAGLSADRRSFALLGTAQNVETAIVFVHGFGGSPRGTWTEFDMIDKFTRHNPWLDECDLFFYGYESKKTPLLFSAERLRAFLQNLYPNPPASLFQHAGEASPHSRNSGKADRFRQGVSSYTKLVLVAHSEGAAIMRIFLNDVGFQFTEDLKVALDPQYRSLPEDTLDSALLESEAVTSRITGRDQVLAEHHRARTKAEARRLLQEVRYAALNAELRLFAPAHCGALLTGNLLLLTQFFWRLHMVLQSKYVAAVELGSKSGVISSLRDETGELAEELPFLPSLRAKILWGERDGTADKQKFRYDTFEVVPDQNHVSVCKPRADYTKPVSFIEYGRRAESAAV